MRDVRLPPGPLTIPHAVPIALAAAALVLTGPTVVGGDTEDHDRRVSSGDAAVAAEKDGPRTREGRGAPRARDVATLRRSGAGLERGRQEERRSAPPRPPFAIDCGPLRDEDGEALTAGALGSSRLLPDLPFSVRRGWGHEGGEPFRRWYSLVWGQPRPHLFTSGRAGVKAYRFTLDPGEYLVSLGFCEGEHHRRGKRLFDVTAQGETFVEGLDPFAVARRDQAFRLTRRVRVGSRRELALRFHPRVGEALVNAIWIHPVPPGAGPPPPPQAFRGQASFGMNVLFWEPPDNPAAAGTILERRGPGEDRFRPLAAAPIPVSRWIDREVRPGSSYAYRAATASPGGGRGPYGPVVTVRPRAPGSARLPAYRLEVPEEALAYMLDNVSEDRTVDGVFTLRESSYPVKLRIRGASTRLAAKKSYRIRFPGRSPFPRDVIFLKAEPHDPSLQQEKLTCQVFAALGLPVSEAAYVHLFLNGRYQGVYVDIEPIREPFTERVGLDPRGTLIRARSFGRLGDREPGRLRGRQGSVEELAEFFRRMHRVERGQLAAFVRSATDWPRLRDYLAASVICHRSEIEADDVFYYRDPETLRWSLIPWDHNNGNFGITGPRDGPGEPFGSVYGEPHHELPRRVFQVRSLGREYLDRLEGLVQEFLLGERIAAMVEENFRLLCPEALADPYRWPPGRQSPLLLSRRRLERFLDEHGERLLRLIERERR